MHVGDMGKGMVPGIAIVGGGIPLAAGMALAFKMQKSDRVVACFFGDGAVAEGAFHEGVNMAAIWRLPVDLRLREQSVRSLARTIDLVMRNARIADRAAQYGIRWRDSRRQRRAGCLRGDRAGASRIAGPATGRFSRVADLSPHRPFATRSLPLSAEGRERGMGGTAIPIERSAELAFRRSGSADDSGNRRDAVATRRNASPRRSKSAPRRAATVHRRFARPTFRRGRDEATGNRGGAARRRSPRRWSGTSASSASARTLACPAGGAARSR